MSCTYVFLQNDTVKTPLQPPYDDLFLVIKRSPKCFTIQKDNRTNTISLDRLKPAHIENDFSQQHQTSVCRNNNPNHPSILWDKKEHVKTSVVTARSGRRVRFTDRLLYRCQAKLTWSTESYRWFLPGRHFRLSKS
ncbi:hypothetical protein EG68_07618 [Paragonimus skrjabini miyazakii]|uniref:Uncharacterized protein n=1 Tax=Paragonimus skrjabini miyazakii TaxID=59628 RepID=A0A8S9YNE6_9TREM|nr:hypothetical protein EG68_07618 [Paragonimus skrjabini miyazakii]